MDTNPAGGKILGSAEGPVPIIRMYGVCQDGRSVMSNIHGFTPYFYVSPPSGFDLSDNSLGLLRNSLDQRVSIKFKVII